ncbi:flavodoxin family protein [Paenibacillus campi]|uniref:flavodoxin family protein n=1 Tax=Paenibacillus campi TaxID=3106031 RepID=UPI002AFEFF74|nr:flavodoxin family protein [Paenibacillus sp. SGZ-1014]
MSFLHLDGSAREDGNTAILARQLLAGLDYTEIALRHHRIEWIDDKRHDPEGFRPRQDDYEQVLTSFLEADYVVFSSPVYWYGLSAQLKVFIDRWSESLRIVPDFKQRVQNKKICLVLVGGDDPQRKAQPIVQQFQYIAEFLELEWQGHLIGLGNKPGDIWQDSIALEQAAQLNKQLKQVEVEERIQ